MITIIKLLRMLAPFWGHILLSVFMGSATILSAIGLMGASAFIIAGAALHPSIAELQVAIVGVRFFGISRGIFRYLERLSSHSVNFRLLEVIRINFFRVIEKRSPAGLLTSHSGDLLARSVGDINTLENFYVRSIAPVVVAIVITLGMGHFIGQMDGAISLLIVLGLVLCGGVVPWITRKLANQTGRKYIQYRADLNIIIVDAVKGMAELIAFGADKTQMRKLQGINSLINGVAQRLAWLSGLSAGVFTIIQNLTLVGAMVIAIPFLAEAGISGIVLAVLATITLSAFEAVQSLPAAAQSLDASLEAGNRIFELSDQAVDIPTGGIIPIKSSFMNISIEGISFRYQARRERVLKGLTIDLPYGKHVAVVGPSGGGKSTLFNLLLGFWAMQEGEIKLNGINLSQYSVNEVRSRIAWLPQKPVIIAGTIRENLHMAKTDANQQELEAALDRVNLTGWLAKSPRGLDTWLGEGGMLVSGGELQRLAIARLLLQRPSLYLLDEPDVHLDPENAGLICRVLEDAIRGKSAIWISHSLVGLEQMDEIIVVNNGYVVERGSYQGLIHRGEYLRKMIDAGIFN